MLIVVSLQGSEASLSVVLADVKVTGVSRDHSTTLEDFTRPVSIAKHTFVLIHPAPKAKQT